MFRVASSVILTLILIIVLLTGVTELPQFGLADAPPHNEVMEKFNSESVEDTGSYNVVSAIVLDYRGFDTLIEATVLFCAAIIIIVSLKKPEGESDEELNT